MNQTIRYQIENGFATGEGTVCGRQAKILFSPKTEGFLSVGGALFPVTAGETNLPLDAVTDGTHETVLITKDGTVGCDRLEKVGDTLFPAPLGDTEIRALRSKVGKLQNTVSELEAKCEELCRAVFQSQLF
ncbi:MAG: hypothetical protein MJ082_05225 [Clostridia bacterium]|nr:hypothetical protein [Clostridia bacterium]